MDEVVVKNNIRSIRKKLGLTQTELAEKLGISQVHLGRLEKNARSLDLEMVEKIATALNVKPYDILPKEWFPIDITPAELEVIRMIRKASTTQDTDIEDLPAQSQNPINLRQPSKSQER